MFLGKGQGGAHASGLDVQGLIQKGGYLLLGDIIQFRQRLPVPFKIAGEVEGQGVEFAGFFGDALGLLFYFFGGSVFEGGEVLRRQGSELFWIGGDKGVGPVFEGIGRVGGRPNKTARANAKSSKRMGTPKN